MKKVIILFVALILLTGCKECKKCTPCEKCETETKVTHEELKDILISYGYYVYQDGIFAKDSGNIKTYEINIKDLYERNKYDIIPFIRNNCKLETTKIEFTISSLEPLVFEYNPILDCE